MLSSLARPYFAADISLQVKTGRGLQNEAEIMLYHELIRSHLPPEECRRKLIMDLEFSADNQEFLENILKFYQENGFWDLTYDLCVRSLDERKTFYSGDLNILGALIKSVPRYRDPEA